METINLEYNIFCKDNMLEVYYKKSNETTDTNIIAEQFIQNTFLSEGGELKICVNKEGAYGNIQNSYITFNNSENYIVLTTILGGFKISIMSNYMELYSINLLKPVNTKLIKSLVNGILEYMYNERLI